MSQSPSEVYIRQLLPQKHGFPLYVPEPADDLPAEYRDKGISIGDVGIMKPNGSFDFVFNICAAADDSVNCYGVPVGFEQVTMLPGDISHLNNMFPLGSDVSSASVKKQSIDVQGALKENELVNIPAGISVGYSLTSASSEAAILTLPEGAAREDLRNIAKFRHHAIENAPRWYEFVNGTLGREAPNGSLYLVTGCDKSTTWGIASVSCASDANAVSLKFTAAQLVETSATFTYKWETYCPATVRIGPESRGNPEQLQNQCVFLRGFKITIRDGPLAALKGSAKVSSILNAKPSNILPGEKRSYTFMDSGKRSWSGKGSKQSGSGSGQQRTQESWDTQEAETEDEEASDEDVNLESVPGANEDYNPLTAINKYLLDITPDAQVAVTHESDWYALSNNDGDLPVGDELFSRLRDRYRPSTSFGGVFLVPRGMEQPDDCTSASVKLCAIRDSNFPSKIYGEARWQAPELYALGLTDTIEIKDVYHCEVCSGFPLIGLLFRTPRQIYPGGDPPYGTTYDTRATLTNVPSGGRTDQLLHGFSAKRAGLNDEVSSSQGLAQPRTIDRHLELENQSNENPFDNPGTTPALQVLHRKPDHWFPPFEPGSSDSNEFNHQISGGLKRTHHLMDFYIFSCVMYDLIRVFGTLINIKWVHEGNVKTGVYRTTQGAIQQIGDVGFALTTLIIAIHTFIAFISWTRGKLKYTLLIANIVVWLRSIPLVTRSVFVHTRGSDLYGNSSPHWAWISTGKCYAGEGIAGEYFWFWSTFFLSILLYLLLFIGARGIITVDPRHWWKLRIRAMDDIHIVVPNRREKIHLAMIAYPVIYHILVLPLIFVRWNTISKCDISPLATFADISIYSLSGALNALLLLSALSDLFFLPNSTSVAPGFASNADADFKIRARVVEIARESANTGLVVT